MTPVELETYIRQQYNAVGDTFYSQDELFGHITQAQMELATETSCIREIYTTSTVAGTQEYAKPTNSLSIKRINYDNVKLAPIDMRSDDALRFGSQTTTVTGSPIYYYEWGASIFLQPAPDAAGTLKIFSFDGPQAVSSTSTLDVPARYHRDLAVYVLWQMALKDKNTAMADRYQSRWEAAVKKIKAGERKILRGDSFYGVQDSETLQESVVGAL